MHVSDVTNEILNNPRFEGAMESITWLTDWTDVGFGMAITVVAFLIILVAMFKNVLAAAYCAYPKFWDHVNEAHEKKKDTNFLAQTVDMFKNTRGGNIGAVNGSTVGEIIMGVIPNIKRMTDFEGDNISPKNYFMKAIPQMLICVCLGAFIYNGSYRDVAAIVVDTGTELLNRTLLSADPIAMYDKFTATSGRPVFSTDGALDARGKYENALTNRLYDAVRGTYTDIESANQKRMLADWIEVQSYNILEEVVNYPDMQEKQLINGNNTDFEMTVNLNWSTSDMEESKLEGARGFVKDDPVTLQYATILKVDPAACGSDMTVDSAQYIFIRLVFVKGTPQGSNSAGITNGTMYISLSGRLEVPYMKNSGGQVWFDRLSSTGSITVGDGSDTSKRVITVTGTKGDEIPVNWQVRTVDAQGNEYTHSITKVVIDSTKAGQVIDGASNPYWPNGISVTATGPQGPVKDNSNPSTTPPSEEGAT